MAEAKERADWPLWREAVNRELQSIFEKAVYEDMSADLVPEGKTPIPTKWVFDYKTDCHNEVLDRKARLVAKGFHQSPGIDYGETYAPTIQDTTLRLLLQYAAEWKLTVNQIDVKTAFLNGELVEEVYVLPPPGLPLKGRVWRLNTALYGLKQAANAWYSKWTEAMLEIGLKPTEADPCLFVGNGVRVGLYVDDALIFGNTEKVERLIQQIKSKFEIKHMGDLSTGNSFKFLGMELERSTTPKIGIVMKQERYARLLLERFNMSKCNAVSTPMVPGLKLSHEGEELPENNEYAAIVGSLLYLAVKTRPDISYAVGVLTRFMSCPRLPHLQAAKRVLRYISKDPGAGLFFAGRMFKEKRTPSLRCKLFSDADFAGDPVMRKSTSGMVLMVNGAPVMWKSRLQSIVALSTCEAEFVAAGAAAREGLWFKKLLSAVAGREGPLDLFCDNESALVLLNSAAPKVTGRTKHIDVQFWFVLDHIMKGELVPCVVKSENMLADCFTKPYAGPAVESNMRRLGMRVSDTCDKSE